MRLEYSPARCNKNKCHLTTNKYNYVFPTHYEKVSYEICRKQ